MFHASRVGLKSVLRRMKEFAANPLAEPAFWKPATLLARLAAEGRTFDDTPSAATTRQKRRTPPKPTRRIPRKPAKKSASKPARKPGRKTSRKKGGRRG
jgi:hypothetical protein